MKNSVQQLLQPLGINQLTPIQKESLENYALHSEMILYAPTGSGKTLAFLLPLIELLRNNDSETGIQAIILSPTRELALQIETVFKSLKTEFSITACYGGHSIKTEINNLLANPTIVVGTPGRISDHLNRKNLSLKQTSYFIVDEFDKCLELGFHVEIEHIYRQPRYLHHSIYGSATRIDEFPEFITLENPVYIDQIVEEDLQPDIQFFSLETKEHKLNTLKYLISGFNHEPTIIFCNFREDVEGIASYFEDNDMSITAYHGGLEQDERERALIKFRNYSCPVLVCTDLGSRGLDIPEVKHIVHFMLPDKEDAFIHRNGRTARMMANGNVYFFYEDYPKFELPQAKPFKVNTHLDYMQSEWTTIYFSGGKKNKINKIDLLGFICQQGGIDKSDVGVISVLDFSSYVAVKTGVVYDVIQATKGLKVKGQKLKIALSQ